MLCGGAQQKRAHAFEQERPRRQRTHFSQTIHGRVRPLLSIKHFHDRWSDVLNDTGS